MVVECVNVRPEGGQLAVVRTVRVVEAAVLEAFFVVADAFCAVGCVALVDTCIAQGVAELVIF